MERVPSKSQSCLIALIRVIFVALAPRSQPQSQINIANHMIHPEAIHLAGARELANEVLPAKIIIEDKYTYNSTKNGRVLKYQRPK
jgi:hypothetical protein